tara:strand:- start:36192 stop:36551 length:360 start_codon:yes stop_codon:yes gene_type:complete
MLSKSTSDEVNTMNINERIENKLLNRIEISFSWKHEGKTTPSRKDIMDLVRTLEPGSNPEWIVVKDCETRYGQPLTIGTAYIYNSQEAMAVEPSYIDKRHEPFRSGSSKSDKSSDGGGQ